MDDYSPPAETLESRMGRRLFLSQSMTVGTVAALGLASHKSEVMASQSRLADEDVCKPSAADTLLLYLDLLLNVQSEAFVIASAGILTASKNCHQTLQKLQDQIDILRVEIQTSRTASQIQQLHDAIELGNAQVEIIKASLGSRPSKPAVSSTSLAAVSNHINRTVQDLLPPGEIKLTGKAKAALEEVLRLLKQFGQVPEQTRLAQEQYQCRINKIGVQIKAIRNGLFEASSRVTEAEMMNSSTREQEERSKAAAMIEEVKEKVRALKESPEGCNLLGAGAASVPSAPVPPSSTPSIDLMVAILEGTARVVRNPQLISRGNNPTGEPRFLPAAFGDYSSVSDSLFSRVQRAIDDKCPRGTPFRTAWCVNLILGPLGFSDPQMRISLIAGVLSLFPCWRGDKPGLVVKLADI